MSEQIIRNKGEGTMMDDLISRQAAFDALNTVYNEWQTQESCKALEEATSMIEGLPSAQPEILACGEGELNVPDINVGDMISRQAAIEAIMAQSGVVDKSVAKRVLAQLPSAERNGKWINHRNDSGHNIADCSECGSTIQWFDDDEKPRFCCMCGSRNKEEEKE